MKVYQFYMQKEHRFNSGEDVHVLYYEEDGDIYEEYVAAEEIYEMIHDLEDCIYIRATSDNEVTIKAYRENEVYFSMDKTAIFTVEEDEEHIVFVFEKWQSRMLEIEFSPTLPIHFGLFFESCTDCDEME